MDIVSTLLSGIWEIIATWYWIALPFLAVPIFLKAWLWWHQERWESKQNYVLLELVPPKESVLPLQAMENVLSSLYSIHTSLYGFKNLFKRWFEGTKPSYLSLEIVSIGDIPHMLIRCLEDHVEAVETALYSQYPELEIVRVKDYVKQVPLTAPNSQWDLYGMDLVLKKPSPIPIKTHSLFFEQKPESVKEEKRIDPITTLLEGISKLKEGENLWVQIRIEPASNSETGFVTEGKKLINKLIHRDEKSKSSNSTLGRVAKDFGDVASNLPTAALQPPVFGKAADANKKDSFIPPEMKLTAREKFVVTAIEEKISKAAFKTNIRSLYIAHKDVFTKTHRSLAEQFFLEFQAEDLNGFAKIKKTRTKTYFYHIFQKRFDYLKKKQLFRRYILRATPFWPKEGGTFILNSEELATIFHIPLRVGKVGTFLPRTESRKGEPPSQLFTRGEPATLEAEEQPESESQPPAQPGESTKGQPPSELPTL